MDERFEGGYTVAFVTNEYHVYRAQSLAENAGFEKATHMHISTRWHSVLPCVLRECIGVVKFWVFKN